MPCLKGHLLLTQLHHFLPVGMPVGDLYPFERETRTRDFV